MSQSRSSCSRLVGGSRRKIVNCWRCASRGSNGQRLPRASAVNRMPCANGSLAPARWWPSNLGSSRTNMTDSTDAEARRRRRPDDKTLSPLSLLLLDQQERWQRGECPLAESYLDQHPSLRDQLDQVLTL